MASAASDPIEDCSSTAQQPSQETQTPAQLDMHGSQIEHLHAQIANLEARIAKLEEDKQWALQRLLPLHPAWHHLCNPFCFIVQRIAALETLACSNLNALQAFANRPDPFAPASTIPVD